MRELAASRQVSRSRRQSPGVDTHAVLNIRVVLDAAIPGTRAQGGLRPRAGVWPGRRHLGGASQLRAASMLTLTMLRICATGVMHLPACG
jgi:hypothetical protein